MDRCFDHDDFGMDTHGKPLDGDLGITLRLRTRLWHGARHGPHERRFDALGAYGYAGT